MIALAQIALPILLGLFGIFACLSTICTHRENLEAWARLKAERDAQ